MVVGAAGSYIRVISVDSESEWDAPMADDCFEGEDMTINEYDGANKRKHNNKEIAQPRDGGEKAVNRQAQERVR